MKNMQDEREQQHQRGAEVLLRPLSRNSSIWLPTMLVFGEPDTMVFV